MFFNVKIYMKQTKGGLCKIPISGKGYCNNKRKTAFTAQCLPAFN